MKFLRRPIPVEAVPLDAMRWSDVTAFLVGTTARGIEMDGKLGVLFCKEDGTPALAREGEWLIREDGELTSCDDATFQERYARADAPPARETNLEWMLRTLLARVHRDGGHYATEHGLEKATRDADAIVAALYNERSDLQHRIAQLEEDERDRGYENMEKDRS